jgi:hypothetical protein
MTPAQARAMYLRALAKHGDTVTVRRTVGAVNTDGSVRAQVTGYAPAELVNGIQQGDRRVILMPDSLAAAGWPLPIKKNDKLVLSTGKVLNVEVVDDQTRRLADDLIAYELVARG